MAFCLPAILAKPGQVEARGLKRLLFTLLIFRLNYIQTDFVVEEVLLEI
jgi:hypothetical protein